MRSVIFLLDYRCTSSLHLNTPHSQCVTLSAQKWEKMIYILSCNRGISAKACKLETFSSSSVWPSSVLLTVWFFFDKVSVRKQLFQCPSEQWAGDISGQEKLKGFSRSLLKKFSLRWHLSCPTKTRPLKKKKKHKSHHILALIYQQCNTDVCVMHCFTQSVWFT